MSLSVTLRRFGQAVIQDCPHCKTPDDYALYAFPAPLIEYVREATLIGLLTSSFTGRGRWRKYALGCLGAAGMGEAWFTLSAPVTVSGHGKDDFMVRA